MARQPLSPRNVLMGGFEQKQFGKAGVAGARLSLLLSGVDASRVVNACRGQPSIDRPGGVRNISTALAVARQQQHPAARMGRVRPQMQHWIADRAEIAAQDLLAAPGFRTNRTAGGIAFTETKQACGGIVGARAQAKAEQA